MEIVINQWFNKWLQPDIPNENQKALWNEFFQKFLNKKGEDKLVIIQHSPWMAELLSIEKKYYDNIIRKRIQEICKICLDPNYVRILPQPAIIPEDVVQLLEPGNFSSDRFLFEAAGHTEDKIIITTDQKLIDQFANQTKFRLLQISDFLKEY